MSDDLEERVAQLDQQLEQRVGGLADALDGTDDNVKQLQEEKESLQQQVKVLSAEIQEVKQFTDLLSPTEDVSKSKETRAALALRTLWNTATNTNGVAALDANGVVDANQGEIGRSWAHEVMQLIPNLVGDEDVCWRIEEDRHATDNTRVVLDLTNRNDPSSVVPGTTQGVPIHGGPSADD